MTMASDTIGHDYDRIPVIMPYKAIDKSLTVAEKRKKCYLLPFYYCPSVF